MVKNYLTTQIRRTMKGIRKIDKLAEIPAYTYEGYVWMSDSKEPKVLINENFDFGSIKTNPFVIEALLYSPDEEVSIHVQHTGDYQIYAYSLKEFSQLDMSEKEYLPHRLKNVSKLKFKQLWLPEADVNCEGMEVMTLKAIVFCGLLN